MERQKLKPKLAIYFMIIMFSVGFIGFNFSYTEKLFRFLVPFHLILTASVLFLFHKKWDTKFITWCLFTAIFGYFIEVIGVKTSFIFGSYSYGNTLGLKLFDVPLLISINWLVLAYCSGSISSKFYQDNELKSDNFFIKSAFGAFLMVFIDYFIEPIAIRFDYWSWKDVNIPLQNYFAWFVISYMIIFFFHLLKIKEKNPLGLSIYLMQLIFFMSFALIQVLKIF